MNQDASIGSATRIGSIGIWASELRFGDRGEIRDAAAELDELGYGALWIPGGAGGALLDDVDDLLGCTKAAVIATGILNIWRHDPTAVAAWQSGLKPDHRQRVLLGLGVSHAPSIGDAYKRPLSVMRDYLARLSHAGVRAGDLCLAALGPKMLELSRDQTAGAHPYLVTPEHTATARAILGPDAVLAPEQGVVLETDPVRAREIARQGLSRYLTYANYAANWRRLGFSDQEISGASDRFVDAIVAWGSVEQIAERVKAHVDAGANHVCLQVFTGSSTLDVRSARGPWRELASVLIKT